MTQKELQTYIEKEIADTKATVSVLVKDFATNEVLISFNADHRVVSASTIKTCMMLTALDLVQHGKLSLTDPIPVKQEDLLGDSHVFESGPQSMSLRELLVWMIINSDNTATNVLMNLLTMPRVNEYCRSLGLKNSILERKMLDMDAVKQGRNNYTSAADQLRMFESLYRKTILTPALCETALSILKQNRDYTYALRYITDVTAAHKTGELDHLAHDTGILYLTHKAYFFGFFVTEDEEDKGPQLIGRISRAVYRYFNHPFAVCK